MARRSVFISYAHKDGLDFTRRIAFALDMYMDVFWDRQLPATDYPRELEEQIENRDYLLLVMTPYSIVSEWCKHELAHAEEQSKGIALARVFLGGGTTDPTLITKYTYGDFTEDFDAGFRRITMMMLGQSVSSWEYLATQDDPQILAALNAHVLPGVIAKSFAEWLLADKLWSFIGYRISVLFETRGLPSIEIGQPKTPLGMLRKCSQLQEQFSVLSTRPGRDLLDRSGMVVADYVRLVENVGEDDHPHLCEAAFNLFTRVRPIIFHDTRGLTSPAQRSLSRRNYEFDAAEKLRELINMHARRSRYLY